MDNKEVKNIGYPNVSIVLVFSKKDGSGISLKYFLPLLEKFMQKYNIRAGGFVSQCNNIGEEMDNTQQLLIPKKQHVNDIVPFPLYMLPNYNEEGDLHEHIKRDSQDTTISSEES